MNRFVSRFAVILLIAIGLYGAFVAWTGYADIRESLRGFRGSMFLLAVALATANYALRIVRWEFYLRRLGIRIPLADSALSFLSGFAFTMTPTKVGEVFKSAVLLETHGIPVAKTAPIVVAERLSDVIGVVALVLAGSLGFEGGLVWALAGLACVVVGMFLILKKGPLEWAVGLVGRGPAKISRFVPKLQEAVDALRLISGRGAILVPTVLSVAAWGVEGLSLHVILTGFGADCGVPLSVFFYATSTLAGALVPLLPSGLGVTEPLMQQLLVRLGGISAGTATTGMLLTRFATLWWAVALGFAALGILKLRYPKFLALRNVGSAGSDEAAAKSKDGGASEESEEEERRG